MENIVPWYVAEYIKNDIKTTEEMRLRANPYLQSKIKIKNVIFNNPATIVFWADGTKTVVKTNNGDIFDPEKGLAMAISKKALGNKGNYYDKLKKWLPKKEETSKPIATSDIIDKLNQLSDFYNKTFNNKPNLGTTSIISCDTCSFEKGFSTRCISCEPYNYRYWTPKDSTEAGSK